MHEARFCTEIIDLQAVQCTIDTHWKNDQTSFNSVQRNWLLFLIKSVKETFPSKFQRSQKAGNNYTIMHW